MNVSHTEFSRQAKTWTSVRPWLPARPAGVLPHVLRRGGAGGAASGCGTPRGVVARAPLGAPPTVPYRVRRMGRFLSQRGGRGASIIVSAEDGAR
jgi:hypothetical protein